MSINQFTGLCAVLWLILNSFTPAHAAVTLADVKIVYYRLCKAQGKCLNAYIVKNNKVSNAWSSVDGVFITTKFMKEIQNRDQLAIILGHELGHIQNGDTTNSWHTYQMEYDADSYGAQLTKRAGYNRCKGANWLIEDMKLYGDDNSIDHPRDSLRLDRIGCRRK